MRKISRICLWVALSALTGWFPTLRAVAAEEDRPATAERLDRLERRLNEMAERQEQLTRMMTGAQERQRPGILQRERPLPAGGIPNPRNLPPRGPANLQTLPPGAPAMPAPPPVGKGQNALKDMVGMLFLIGILCNILLAIWIFTDIRKRGEGSGLFIALALVAGIPAAIIYSLVRLGDRRAG